MVKKKIDKLKFEDEIPEQFRNCDTPLVIRSVGEFKDVVIRVGDEPDYESKVAWLCETLRAAIDLVTSATPTTASEER